MGKAKVIINIRQANGQAHMAHSMLLFEWQPDPTSNGTWYKIRRDNISFVSTPATLRKHQLIEHLFSALRCELTIVVYAKYFRAEKRLVLNPQHNGGDL